MMDGAHRADLEAVAHCLGVDPGQLLGGLNLVEAAEVLGIAPSTLRQRALAGRIGFQRDGKAWRFFFWHMSEYLEHREHPAGEPDCSHRSKSKHTRRVRPRADDADIKARAQELGLI